MKINELIFSNHQMWTTSKESWYWCHEEQEAVILRVCSQVTPYVEEEGHLDLAVAPTVTYPIALSMHWPHLETLLPVNTNWLASL
jgi:hypothetical protein